MSEPQFTVEQIPAARTHELRRSVLRDGAPEADVVWPGDDAGDTIHLAALDGIIEQQVAALEAGEYGRFFALDEALHHAIFEISGVGGVWETARCAQTELYRIRHLKRICGECECRA